MVSTTMPKGCVERIQAEPIQSGPTTVLGSKRTVSPGDTVKTSPSTGRMQSSCALNQISSDVQSMPEFWMFRMLDRPPRPTSTSGV